MIDIDKILNEICKKGSIYDEIMSNVLNPRLDLKPELISELALSFLENKEKIVDVYEKGYFKYYFINACRNQVHSSTSSFHKNIRIKDYEYIDNYIGLLDEDDIDQKIEFEKRLETIQETYKGVKKSWFEDKMFDEYFGKNKTYREIEREYGLDHSLVWVNVKKVKDRLIDKLKQK